MFYWENRDSVDNVGNMSKADILREIVKEKLATAAREILAVVERIVAGYEEEASGFREEIDRQRRQLEAFQPKVKLETRGVEDTGIQSLFCSEEDEEQSALNSRQSRDAKKDPDYQTPSRSLKRTSKKTKQGQCRTNLVVNHVALRVCILENPQSSILPKNVLKTSLVQELQCPRGLQEAEFLGLLRSTFPQLAGGQHFDIFTPDSNRNLQPLKLSILTPEEIRRSTTSTGTGNPFIYIRLKKNSDVTEEPFSWSALQKNDDTGLCASSAEDNGVDQTSTSQKQEVMETEDLSNGGDDDLSDLMENTETCMDDSEDGGEGSCKGNDDWKPDLRDNKRSDSVLQSSSILDSKGAKRVLTDKTKIHCKICGVFYKFMGSLVKHARNHIGEPERLCGVCGVHFQSEDELVEHLKTYQKMYECSYCGKSFSQSKSLTQHITVHTGDRLHKCDVCQKAFSCKSMLRTHQWVHVTDKPHKCEVCQKSFGLTSQLKAHRKLHTDKERFHCIICGISVYDRKSLLRHQATHKEERRYGCQVCGKHFKIQQTLRDHAKIHTARDRTYLCHVCCKTFVAKSCLNVHIKTHTKERPYVCKVCDQGCLTKGALSIHMRVHSGETPYSCTECGRSFKNKSNLKGHMMTHTGVKLFFCGVCGKGVARREHLTVHMRTHNGERPYQCTLCDKAFTQSHCLKSHMKTHQVADEFKSSQEEEVQSNLC
ncbi:oocyte zinc finger protein XlCOF22-like [Thalassophryne amazonica]|uniref:oocyte zinc finger protein XlCOF22-like n=1 Tax=Thalassophryne amazonica TaxID=390379 RepID=UPI001470A984|nr:oocyte zinc finger protein XlCOF22-like [Thalassophryne amazonica]